ncbi:MAG: cysteine synthase A [Bacillota bacterium]|nr:cysteine synthase A [Bacillota bacterium]
MAKIADSIIDLIGNTPLLDLSRYSKANKIEAKIIGKLEFFNPLGSVKDRVGYAMINDALDKGIINKDTVIIEPTSGNTGIALAFACAALEMKVIIVMPDSMSIERRNLLKMLGAELVLTSGAEGMGGAISKAKEISAKTKNSFIPQQFENPANAEIHRKTTGEEIWRDTDGKVDIFVAGVGSGGTISGVAKVLKEKNPKIKIVAVEPANSNVLSGGTAGPHMIQGLGAGFIPEIIDTSLIDIVFPVGDYEAINTTRELAKREGILAGISSGAAVYAAAKIGKKAENRGKNIVVLLPDTGERYVSSSLFQDL